MIVYDLREWIRLLSFTLMVVNRFSYLRYSFSGINFKSDERNNRYRSSSNEPREIYKYRIKSFVLFFEWPSTILLGIEIAALFI